MIWLPCETKDLRECFAVGRRLGGLEQEAGYGLGHSVVGLQMWPQNRSQSCVELCSKVRGFWSPGDGCWHTQHGAGLASPGLGGGLRLTPFVSQINFGMPSPSRAALMHWHHGHSGHMAFPCSQQIESLRWTTTGGASFADSQSDFCVSLLSQQAPRFISGWYLPCSTGCGPLVRPVSH